MSLRLRETRIQSEEKASQGLQRCNQQLQVVGVFVLVVVVLVGIFLVVTCTGMSSTCADFAL